MGCTKSGLYNEMVSIPRWSLTNDRLSRYRMFTVVTEGTGSNMFNYQCASYNLHLISVASISQGE